MTSDAAAAQRVILRPTELEGAAVELFIALPESARPRPTILYVHGHQEPARPGGRALVEAGRLERMAALRFVAAGPSPPPWSRPRSRACAG